MNKTVHKMMLRCVTIVPVFAAVALSACAETKGLWVFPGTDGAECAEGTEVPNLIAGSGMTLSAGRVATEGNTAPLPRYTSDIPNTAVYSDAAFSTRLAAIGSSMRLAKGTSTGSGSFITIRNLGASIMENGVAQDFTVEMFVRPDKNAKVLSNTTGDSQEMFLGIGSDTAAMLLHGTYNYPSGSLGANSGSEGVVYCTYGTGWGSCPSQRWMNRRSLFNGEWHHYALVYTASDATMRCYIDYEAANTDTGNGGVTWSGGMPLRSDSMLKILGKFTYSHFLSGVTVSAIRVSSGALGASSFMRIARDPVTSPVLAWWRFENGVPGGAFVPCTNEFAGSYMPQIAHNPPWGGCNNNYVRAVKRFVCAGKPWESVASTNDVALWWCGDASLGDSAGVGVKVTGFEEFAAIPGSFTAEGFYFLAVNATDKDGYTGNDRQTLMGEFDSSSNTPGWGVRTDHRRYASLVLNRIVDTTTGARGGDTVVSFPFSTGRWHHVAVVYDDEANPKTLTCFVDYVQAAQIELEAGQAIPRAKDGTLYLAGAHCNDSNTSWFGGFDEFRVTRIALEPDDFLHSSNLTGVIINFR